MDFCPHFRIGKCKFGDQCRYNHVLCHNGGSCPDRFCNKGHPAGWALAGEAPIGGPPAGGMRANPPSPGIGPNSGLFGAGAAGEVALRANVANDDGIIWETFDVENKMWQAIPNSWFNAQLTERFQKKVMQFQITMKSDKIAVDLILGTQDWIQKRKHLHLRGRRNGKVIAGGDSSCARCDRRPMMCTRENRDEVEWLSYDARKGVWVPYDRRTSDILEEARKQDKHGSVRIVLGDMKFLVKFDKMIQENEQGLHRHVVRKKCGSLHDGGATACAVCDPTQGGPQTAGGGGGGGAGTRVSFLEQAKDFLGLQQKPKQQAPAQVETAKIVAGLAANPLCNRPMVDLRGAAKVSPSSPKFTLLQWNLLFQVFAKSSPTCPPAYLSFSHRFAVISEYLTRYNADIMTFQEMENTRSEGFASYRSLLRRLGYDERSANKNRNDADACSIFFKSDVFSIVAEKKVVYSKHDMVNLCVNEAQVGLLVILKHKKSGRGVLVATTHLKAAKDDEMVRVEQMQMLMASASMLAKESGAEEVPIVITGDLNTSPRWEVVPAVRRGTWEIGKLLGPMASAYQDEPESGFKDREITIYMPHTQDMLDYIFYEPTTRPGRDYCLAATRLLRVPGERDIVAQSASDFETGVVYRQLPMPSFPSDHFPLMVEFAFVPGVPFVPAPVVPGRAEAEPAAVNAPSPVYDAAAYAAPGPARGNERPPAAISCPPLCNEAMAYAAPGPAMGHQVRPSPVSGPGHAYEVPAAAAAAQSPYAKPHVYAFSSPPSDDPAVPPLATHPSGSSCKDSE